MHHIDNSFLADEPDSWFLSLFKHEHWSATYTDCYRVEQPDDIYTEQVLFQYVEPWTIQVRWSSNAAEVLSGFENTFSTEPILLEWTNLLTNHWSCHWLRKHLAPLAPSALPKRVMEPSQPKEQACVHLSIALLAPTREKQAYIEIDFFLPRGCILDESKEDMCSMDNLALGYVVINAQGEVTHCNNWIQQKEPTLQQKTLPLPWELVFQNNALHSMWGLYDCYKRASYSTPWLPTSESRSTFENGPYIMSLLPFNNGATLLLTPVPALHLNG